MPKDLACWEAVSLMTWVSDLISCRAGVIFCNSVSDKVELDLISETSEVISDNEVLMDSAAETNDLVLEDMVEVSVLMSLTLEAIVLIFGCNSEIFLWMERVVSSIEETF